MANQNFLIRLTSGLQLMVLILLAALPQCPYADAYFITSPAANGFWYMGSKMSLRWTSVSTDPAKFSIAITNQDPNTYPSALSKPIVRGVPKKLEIYVAASALKGLKEGSGYQINIMSLEGGAILAQSPPFTISRPSVEMGEGVDDVIDYSDESEVDTTSSDEHDDKQKSMGGKDDKHRYERLKKLHQKGHNQKAKPYRSRKFHQAKGKSDALYKSTPKFDHSRRACSRSPHNPRVANVLRV
ncbi:hypothetical protein H4Q26_016243 [Puccinia striiformis f. sp. tritici PST-130]|nr:hypothetical protein H4Q26_016243 [Puccinia striiformis f. sp. tritici PST-130]